MKLAMVVNRFFTSVGMLRQENGDSEVPLCYKERPISKTKTKTKTKQQTKTTQEAKGGHKFKVILGYRVSGNQSGLQTKQKPKQPTKGTNKTPSESSPTEAEPGTVHLFAVLS